MSKRFSRGFSIIEMMVSVAIMVIITTVVVTNQSKFGSGASLRNIMNNMSLSLRQAQIYGISVKQFNPDANQTFNISNFNAGYGVNFNISAAPAGDNTSYIFFRDLRPASPPNALPNGFYDSGISCPLNATSECLDKVFLSGGHTISDICTVRSGVEECFYNTLDITFVRPAIEAKLVFDANPGNSAELNVACVEVSAPDGKRNSVVVYTTGQISIRNTTCTDAI